MKHSKNPKNWRTLGSNTLLGSGTTCRRPKTNQKFFSVLIKDVPKDPEFSYSEITKLLTKNFSLAKAQHFIKRDKTISNTVQLDMPIQSDLGIASQNGLFLNNQYFRAYKFNQEERIPIVRCYNWQRIGQIAKTCNSLPKCGKCSEAPATSNCNEQAEKNCAIYQLNYQANDTNCQTYLATATKGYNQ